MEQNSWRRLPIGQKIRFYRKNSELNLKDVAKASGVSASFLSKLERDKAAPSMAHVERICEALRTTVDHLLARPPAVWSEEDPQDEQGTHASKLQPVLVRSNARKRILLPDSELYYELLTPDLQRKLEFTLVRHPPLNESPVFCHEGEESMLCLSGSLRVVVGEKEFLLSAGDCVSFDSSIPHRVVNDTRTEAILVSANTPASF